MKTHWLRGMLLGVSLALLVAGGVALAAPEFSGTVTYTGAAHGPVHVEGSEKLEPWVEKCSDDQPGPGKYYLYCSGVSAGLYICGYMDANGNGAYDAKVDPSGCYDEDGDGNPDVADLFDYGADFKLLDPAVEEVFVPEPATILLLGSGLAGLAGYATLRLSSRRTLR